MKRKLWIIFGIFLLICLGLPFVIELMYTIGESHPIIYTNYSQSDVLGYVASVIGLVVSVLAIMLSIQVNEVDIKITHALTMSDKGNEALLIEICNYSGFDYKINSDLYTDQSRDEMTIEYTKEFIKCTKDSLAHKGPLLHFVKDTLELKMVLDELITKP